MTPAIRSPRHGPTRRQVLASAAAASAWQLLPGCRPAPGPRRPNLLFLLSDAHRASTAGCYGDRFAMTPYMDALAADGLRLATAVSNTPLCRPYRASLMTGALGHHCGLVGNWSEHNKQDTLTEDFTEGTMPRGRQWTPSGLPTLGSTFAASGYRCGYVGKWHLGRVDIDPGPLRMGFDDHWAVSSEPAHDYWNWKYFTGEGPPIEGHDVFKPSVDTDKAIEFLDHDDNRPWCLMLSWAAPHQPFEPPPRFQHFSHVLPPPNVPAGKRPNLEGYYGMIEAVDHELGRILVALQQRRLAENTIVVYTADHGALLGSHGAGGKELPYDGSTRVPFIARWPGRIAPGKTLSAPLGTPDILPSLAGLAGLAPPSVPDGLDLSALLLGGSDARTAPAAYLSCYVSTESKDKPAWRGLRTERHLYACTEQGPWLLYDMLDDPHELINLVEAGHPLVAELHARTLDTMSSVGDAWLT